MPKVHKGIEDFNNMIFSLIEEKICKVEYFGLQSEFEGEIYSSNYKTNFSDVHSFELGLVLHMESENIFEFIWDNSFYCYGIGIVKNNFPDYQSEGVEKWVMTDDDLWKKYIGKEITNVSINWSSSMSVISHSPNKSEIGKKTKEIHPETCILYFHGTDDVIIISSSGFLGEDCDIVFTGHDNIIVTNNKETAVRIKLF